MVTEWTKVLFENIPIFGPALAWEKAKHSGFLSHLSSKVDTGMDRIRFIISLKSYGTCGIIYDISNLFYLRQPLNLQTSSRMERQGHGFPQFLG